MWEGFWRWALCIMQMSVVRDEGIGDQMDDVGHNVRLLSSLRIADNREKMKELYGPIIVWQRLNNEPELRKWIERSSAWVMEPHS